MDISLELLLSKRDYDNIAFTRQIIALFGENLSKAVCLIFKMDRRIQWKTVNRYNPLPGYVTITGDIQTDVGDLIRTLNGEVLITEDNINDYTNTLRYVLKSSIIQHGTIEDIYQHITFVAAMSNALEEKELMDLLRSGAVCHTSAIENPTTEAILDKITRPTVFESFRTESLSEDQFTSLRLNAQAGKNRVQ